MRKNILMYIYLLEKILTIFSAENEEKDKKNKK